MKPQTGTNRAKVLQAIIDLDDHQKKATKQAIIELTHLSVPSVTDSIDALHDCGLIKRLYDGVWIPVDSTPDRIVSTSSLPMGRMKIELGDDVMTLTPRESLALAKQLMGVVMTFKAL